MIAFSSYRYSLSGSPRSPIISELILNKDVRSIVSVIVGNQVLTISFFRQNNALNQIITISTLNKNTYIMVVPVVCKGNHKHMLGQLT